MRRPCITHLRRIALTAHLMTRRATSACRSARSSECAVISVILRADHSKKVNRYQTTGWAASDDVLAIPVRHPTNGRIVAMQRRILVLGAGFLGAAITRTLIDDGYSVSVLTRATPCAFTAQQLQGARVVVGDVGDLAGRERPDSGERPRGLRGRRILAGGLRSRPGERRGHGAGSTGSGPRTPSTAPTRRDHLSVLGWHAGGTVYGIADFIPTREDVAHGRSVPTES